MVFVVLVVGTAAGAGGYSAWTSAPNEIRLDVSLSSPTVAVNEPFTVEIEVENVTLDPVKINAVGLDQSLLDGVVVDQMSVIAAGQETPQPQGTWTDYALDHTLDGGGKLMIRYTLHAIQTGAYQGEANVWVDSEIALGVTRSKARSESVEIQVQ
jgi:hypothetical protein